MDDGDIRDRLSRLDSAGRDVLRRYLVAGQADRDALAVALLRQRTQAASATADLLDMLSLNADARRRVVRLLGELEAQP